MTFNDEKLTVENMIEQTKILISDAKYIYCEQSIFSDENENWTFNGFSSRKDYDEDVKKLCLSNVVHYAKYKIHFDNSNNIWLECWKKSVKINPRTLHIVNFSTKCRHRAFKNPAKFDCLYSMPKVKE